MRPFSRHRAVAAACLLVAITLTAYAPAVANGFIWDDDYYVHNNRTLGSVDGLRRIWFDLSATPQYYPLVFTAYWLQFRLWGLQSAGYHVVNILLHALVCLLLWRVLRRLEVPGAWLAAALFAVHPVHVETVAWITELKNLLSAALYLMSGLAYLRWTGSPGPAPAARPAAKGLYATALVLFVGALLSKTVACTLPVALLLVLWWKRGRVRVPDLRPLLPFFALGVAFGLLTAWIETARVGAVGEEWDHSIIERCLIAGRAVWFYLSKLLWPARLTFVYPRWSIDGGVWWQYAFPVLAAVGVALLWVARRRTGRAPLVAALFFAGTLAPALGFFNVYPMRFSYVADHFQYLASLGPIALAASGAWLGLGRLDRRVRPAGAVALLVVVSVLGARTWSQTQVYHDQETLWRDTLRKNPDAWLAHTNLAGVLRAQGRVDEAADHYREAIRLKPDLAYAHSKLGALLREQGRLDASLRHLEEALRLDPGSAEAHNSMALTLKSAGALDAATRQYREAVRLNPEAAPVHYNLGVVLEARGRLDEAIDAYRRALHLQPDLVDAHRKLGLLLLSRGAADRAIPHLRAWQRLSPGDGQARARLDAALRAAQGAGETGDPAAEVGPPAPD